MPLHSTADGFLQRVFTWRWTSPDNQQTFELDVAELERVFEEQRAELRRELDLDRDLEGPCVPQLDVPYAGEGSGPGGRGGRYVDAQGRVRQPPQLDLLARCAPPQPTRLELETGFEDAPPVELARRVGYVFKHRGRPKGLSPADYGAQREFTIARSLTWSFFENCREIPGVPVVWREKFDGAARVLALLLWARRLGRHGFTLSGPEAEAVLDIGIATWWRYVKTLEKAGYLIRLRRWKPGRHGPVALAANWYGFGPRALDELEELEEPKPVMQRARRRVRRKHRRAEGRRRGIELLPGYSFPTLAAFVGQTIDGWRAAQKRDAERWAAFQAGIAPVDFTTARAPSFVFTLADDCAQLRNLAAVLDSEPADVVELAAPEQIGRVAEEVVGGQGVNEGQPTQAERSPESVGGSSGGGFLLGSQEQITGELRPGLTARTRRHRRSVVRPPRSITTPGNKAFAERCANSQIGGVPAVALRDRRSTPSEIPISPRIGAPERREKNLRTGPEAASTSPPRLEREPGLRSPTAEGPPGEAKTAADTVLSGVMDPRLRAVCANLARAIGVIE